jgi:hypothetical protein
MPGILPVSCQSHASALGAPIPELAMPGALVGLHQP